MVQKGAVCHYLCMKRPLLTRFQPGHRPGSCTLAHVQAKRGAGAPRQADMGPLAGWNPTGLGNMARAGRVAQRAAAYHASGRYYPIAPEVVLSKAVGLLRARWQRGVVTPGGCSDQSAHVGDRCVGALRTPTHACLSASTAARATTSCSSIVHRLSAASSIAARASSMLFGGSAWPSPCHHLSPSAGPCHPWAHPCHPHDEVFIRHSDTTASPNNNISRPTSCASDDVDVHLDEDAHYLLKTRR